MLTKPTSVSFAILLMCCIFLVMSCVTSHSPETSEAQEEPLDSPEKSPQMPQLYPPVIQNHEENTNLTDLWFPEDRLPLSYLSALKAKLLQLEGRSKEAAEEYSRAYALSPNAFLGGQMMALRFATESDKTDALKDIHKLTLLYPKSVELKILRGKMLFSRGDYEGASEVFRESLKLSPTSESAYLHLIDILVIQKAHLEALKVAKRYNANLPGGASWIVLSRIYILTGNFEDAWRISKQALVRYPRNMHVLLIHAYISAKLGNIPSAIRHYKRLHALTKYDLATTSEVISVYEQLLGLENAYSTIHSISKQKPHQPHLLPLYKHKIWILLHQKRPHTAIELLTDMGSLATSDELRYLKGLAHNMAKEHRKAMQAFASLREHSPLTAQGLIFASQIALSLKDYSRGIMYVEKLLGWLPLSKEYYLHAILWYRSLKLHHQALAIALQAQHSFPDSAPLVLAQSYLYYDLGEYPKVETSLSELLENYPNHDEALNFLGYFYAERGIKLNKAHELITKALNIAPNHAAYLDSLGWVYYWKEEWEKAEEYLLKAHALKPDDGVIQGHLAALYIKTHQCSKAGAFLLKARLKPMSAKEKQRIHDLEKPFEKACKHTGDKQDSA